MRSESWPRRASILPASDPRTSAELRDIAFDYVVTVCGHAHENCPVFLGKAKVVHVGFDDPPKLAADATTEEERLAPYRRVRDEIREFVQGLPESLQDRYAAISRFAEGSTVPRRCSVYAEDIGFDHDTALKMAAGFGGGMGRMASTCGAVTGAFMALGLQYAGIAADRQTKEANYACIREFADRFKARHGSLGLPRTAGVRHQHSRGAKQAMESGAFKNTCPEFVRDACEILEEMHQSATTTQPSEPKK